MKNLFVLKIGGSVITDRDSMVPRINIENLERIAEEIQKSYDPKKMKLILVHGAGSYGHPIVKRTGIHEGLKNDNHVHAMAETQRLQNKLNVMVTKALIELGVPAIPYQASSHTIMDDGKLAEMDLRSLKGFLDSGLVPVLYGVPAYDKKRVALFFRVMLLRRM